MKPKRRAKRSSNMRYVLLGIAITAIVIIAALATSQPKTKAKASEYFQVVHIASEGEFSGSNKTVKIKTLVLNVTAIGGDAHSVAVTIPGMGETEPPMNASMRQGEPWEVGVQLVAWVVNLNEEDGLFHGHIYLTSEEVEGGPIDVPMNAADIFATSYLP